MIDDQHVKPGLAVLDLLPQACRGGLVCFRFWRLVGGRCASTGAFDRRGVSQRGLGRPRWRCRHGMYGGRQLQKIIDDSKRKT